MERVMNEENEWHQNVKAELVEGPVKGVSQEEVVKAIREMKLGKAAKGMVDAVFILRRLQEEYLDKEKKLYMCFVDLEKGI